jgi:hypothetical protein
VGVQLITITGYLDNIQNFVARVVRKPLQSIKLRDEDKKEVNKVFAQVPKRRPLYHNFGENDPKAAEIQKLVLTKIYEKLEPAPRRNFIARGPSIVNNLFF